MSEYYSSYKELFLDGLDEYELMKHKYANDMLSIEVDNDDEYSIYRKETFWVDRRGEKLKVFFADGDHACYLTFDEEEMKKIKQAIIKTELKERR